MRNYTHLIVDKSCEKIKTKPDISDFSVPQTFSVVYFPTRTPNVDYSATEKLESVWLGLKTQGELQLGQLSVLVDSISNHVVYL